VLAHDSTHHRTARRWRRAVFACAGFAAWPVVTHAQRTPPATLRDSAEALLADSLLDAALDGTLLLPRHRVSARATLRQYDFAGARVQEQAAPLTYAFDGARLAVRISGTPVALSAPSGSLSGASPVRGRMSLRVGVGDTLEVYGQTASAPGALSSSETAALGGITTSTVDLESILLGTTSAMGARAVAGLPLGTTTLGVWLGAEVQPRPTGETPVFWRGRTLSVGTSLAGDLGAARMSARAEWSRSWADSLDGRNLFPGGGALSLSAMLDGPIGDGTTTSGSLSVFFTRPFANDRADQPNRLTPQGQFWGASGELYASRGRVAFIPSVSLIRESSTVAIGTPQLPVQLSSSAWTASAGGAVDLSLGRHLSVTPEAGVAWGSVASSTSTVVRTRRGRAVTIPRGVDDPLRGAWVGVTMTTRW
jgi:hypothetical protein